MARSRDSTGRRRSRLIIAIPLIALAVVTAVIVASFYSDPARPAMDFSDQIFIEISSYTNTTQYEIVHPTRAIGQPGGIWATHQYDGYGVANNYPLYTDDPVFACPNPQSACTFHVKSNTVHPYTLGDFMSIWGYPVVSQNYTFGVASKNSFLWQVCVGASPSQASVDTQWGAMVLQPRMAITMIYYDTATAFGCAAS